MGPSSETSQKETKSWLVVKTDKLHETNEIFNGTGIKITTEGRKYLGGFVGTEEGSEKYVEELCKVWIAQIEELSKIAKCEPQAAYSAFTAGFKHKFTYYIWTIPNLSEVLKPLDDVINNQFLPAITERQTISADNRKLIALQVRLVGLGIPIYSEACVTEFSNSRKLTRKLT